MNDKISILFITNVPSPYRVDFFNELGKYSDLTVVFEKHTSSERDKSWEDYHFDNFNGIILKGIATSVDGAFCPSIVKYLSKHWDRIIITNISTPTGMLAIQYLKTRKKEYWIESDGGFAKSGKGIKESLKKYLISGATGYFSTNTENDKYFTMYGADPNLIYRYPFTSISEKNVLSNIVAVEEKKSIRTQLGMPEKRIVLSVGRFIHLKGFDILIQSAREFTSDIGLYIVGGEPTDEYLNLSDGCNNIHYVGFKSKDELKKYYMAADVFVLPTREDKWGLVVNEAMAYGLPIIATDKCGAAIQLVRNGENGYIVSSESPQMIKERILDIIRDPMVCRDYGIRSSMIIKDYTIEKMARRHIELLEKEKV